MKRFVLLVAIFTATSFHLFARGGEDSTKAMLEQINSYLKLQDSVNKALKYETGKIVLPAGVVQLTVPAGFKYLGVEQSKYVMEDLWGNLPDNSIQGMLFPANSDPFDDSSYAYILSYSQEGHIKDGDAKDMDYDKMMIDMKADDAESNRKRVAGGGTSMYTNGWASKPFYDDQNKVLHWAFDYRVEGRDAHTLNYNIIVLGRKGMLSLNAIATMDQLDSVKANVSKVLGMAEFTAGNRYADFDSKVDDVAAWTVGGLVAGKILAKTAAGVGILKFLKFIIIGVVAAGGAIWRWVTGRKKKEEEFVYQPVTAPIDTEEPKSNLQ
jgi:uncharacterized membrane-anchored protein